MKILSIDIETFSSADLSKTGVYKYVEAMDFAILLFAYSIDGGDVQIVDLANGEDIPTNVLEALTDDNVIKWAHNAAFERVALSRYLRDEGISLDPWADNHHSAAVLGKAKFLNPASWRCTMILSAYNGYPFSLGQVSEVLNLEKKKLKDGNALIRFFCSPCNPTKANGMRSRNLPTHDPEKWSRFKEYNIRDVEAEMEIHTKLAKMPVLDVVWDEYQQGEIINDTGVLLDMTLVRQAIEADARSQGALFNQMQELTGVDNPNSTQQLKHWLAENGIATQSLGKEAVVELLKTAPPHIRQVLTLRQQLAKSSVAKYQAMENSVCNDGRVRGLFQFYGASRTGRAAGRLIQAQNLPQTHMPDLEQARALLRSGNFAALDMLYNSVPDVLSQLIRTAFIPKPDRKFIVADFSSIEAVVLGWLAGEQWVLDAYAAKQDLYIRNAERMFNAPAGSVDKKSPLRQKSKIAVLACGYQGSVGALKNFGALNMGLLEEDLQPLVDAWREANPNIVRFWWDCDNAAKKAVMDKTSVSVRSIRFIYGSGTLRIVLPSGRELAYAKPTIGKNKFGNACVLYEGLNIAKKWTTIESSPGKWVENITQAVARDLLYNALGILKHCDIIMHIHDEIVIEADQRMSLDVICQQMIRLPAWAKGLPLWADGFECDFYRKD